VNSPIRLVAFDLDDTLAESKSAITAQMSQALTRLLEHVDVCIISGGRYEQFQAQVLERLDAPAALVQRLHLMPTCGTRYYRRSGDEWAMVYSEDLAEDDKAMIIAVLAEGARELGLVAAHTWGPTIEDRESQITFSALGQQAPVAEKAAWDPDGTKKGALRDYAAARLPEFEVRSGGSTSIDITRLGIDKSYGMRKLMTALDLQLTDIVFVGDRLDEGGNDYPILAMGIRSIPVTGWHDTVQHIDDLIQELTSPTPTRP
jgi:phosphomannomutase